MITEINKTLNFAERKKLRIQNANLESLNKKWKEIERIYAPLRGNLTEAFKHYQYQCKLNDFGREYQNRLQIQYAGSVIAFIMNNECSRSQQQVC